MTVGLCSIKLESTVDHLYI